jgi:hypothetical protein
MVKRISIILIFLFTAYLPIKAQYTESKERKKMWRKSFKRRKNRQAFNPYLEKKSKDKPSAQLNKTNARDQRRQLRAAKKQKKRSMKKLGIKETKVKKA